MLLEFWLQSNTLWLLNNVYLESGEKLATRWPEVAIENQAILIEKAILGLTLQDRLALNS